MASLLVQNLLGRPQADVEEFIEHACSSAIDILGHNDQDGGKGFSTAMVPPRFKDTDVCDIVDLVADLVSNPEYRAVTGKQSLQNLFDGVCFPVLSTHESSSAVPQSLGGIQHTGSKLVHSVCRLVALYIQRAEETDPLALKVISGIKTSITHNLEDAHCLSSNVGHEDGRADLGLLKTPMAPATSGPSFPIFSALEILEHLQESASDSFIVDLQERKWYRQMIASMIDGIEFTEPPVCARLCSIMMREGLTTEETLHDVWGKVQEMHRKSNMLTRDQQNHMGSNIYLVLCVLSNSLLSPEGVKQHLSSVLSGFHTDATFWSILRQGLLCHEDPLTRKRAIFLLKRALEAAQSQRVPFSVRFGRDAEDHPLIWWAPEDETRLLKIWNDFILFYEALGEVQIHVVQPVLAKWTYLLEAAAPNDEGKAYLHTSWLTLLLERSFRHESKTVTRWGVEQTLRLDVTGIPFMAQGGDKFILGPLLSVLREDYLYIMRSETTPIGQCPQVACQLEGLLNRILTQLIQEQKRDFHRELVTGTCGLMWGPVPLTLLVEVLSRLPGCPAWGPQQLYDFRELLQSSVSVFLPALRSCIQTFLSLAAVRLVDLCSVTLREVFTFLASLNAPGPLRKDDQIWEQLCDWLRANKDTDSPSSEESSFAEDLKTSLTGDDHPSEDNGSSLHVVEVKRLALEIVMLSDVLRSTNKSKDGCPPRDSRLVFRTLTSPLREVLRSVGSRIYLPPGQADRSIQVVTAVISVVLDATSSLINDPVIQELNTLLVESVAEIFIYVKRRIFSLDVSKATSLDKVHIYLELLSAVHSYCTKMKLTDISQVTVELSRYKDSLMKDCQAVLTNSMDTRSPQALFKAYVAIEMISWRLHCSHGNGDIFRDSDLYTKILHMEINRLHDSKKFSGERKDSTGPLIGIFLGRKWGCIHKFLQAGHVTTDYEDVLRRCIHELSLVSDLNCRLVMDCAAFLLKKLVSTCHDLCCEAVTAAWCCVLDFYRDRYFWEVYTSFVAMTFQLELMVQGQETTMFTTISKIIDYILVKGESKLGLVNLVISRTCRVWQRLLAEGQQLSEVTIAVTNYTYLLKRSVLFGSVKKEGRLREEMLFYLSSNSSLGALRETLKSTSIEKDPALVRISVINLLIRLGATKTCDSQRFLEVFLQSLVEEDAAVTPVGKCYVINSQVHRIKQRIWQAALVIVNYISQESSSDLFQKILLQLARENQSSAKHMMEWLVVLLIHRFPSTVTQFWARLDEMIEGSRSGFSPILIILSQLGAVQPSRDAKVSFYTKAIPIIFPWSMAPTVSLRVQSQVALFKIWLDCRRDMLTEVLDRYPALKACMEYNENRGSAITNKMEGNFFLKDFHPLLDYSLETIFQSLPYLTLVIDDELVLPQLFSQESPDLWNDESIECIPLYNKRDTLRMAQKLGKAAEKRKFAFPGSNVDLNVIDYKKKPLPPLGGGDVQKKITPLREELAPGFGDAQETTEARRGQLVVVATLVDRMPNLGGLCRSSEIFGVGRLIVGSARYLEDKSFLGLSVTAEKWLPMKEVRPSELKDYLSEMRLLGYTLVGLEQTANSVQINEYKFPVKTVLLLGNERTGIPVELIHHLDVCVEIPQLGYIRSLNVHVSGALMIWEYTRQMLGLG